MNDRPSANLFAVQAESTGPAPPGTRERLAATRAAVAYAEDAPLREVIDGVRWQRRGFLQRLARQTQRELRPGRLGVLVRQRPSEDTSV
jgi:hypothetical protein